MRDHKKYKPCLSWIVDEEIIADVRKPSHAAGGQEWKKAWVSSSKAVSLWRAKVGWVLWNWCIGLRSYYCLASFLQSIIYFNLRINFLYFDKTSERLICHNSFTLRTKCRPKYLKHNQTSDLFYVVVTFPAFSKTKFFLQNHLTSPRIHMCI